MPLTGVETVYLQSSMLPLFEQAGINMIRRNALLWSLVEPFEGDRNWGAVASLEEELKLAAEANIEVILIVRSTPPWAQKVPGSYCGPVWVEELDTFAAFMHEVVERYSHPPFNVNYYEIGNEPDIAPSLVPLDNIFGCWGNMGDEYYGGGYYGTMLKRVYPEVKSASADANVLIGGLLLDCDPTHPPENKTCQSSLFFEGILREGAGDYFDIVSFHGYPPFTGGKIFEERYVGWADRGGVVYGKADYLREVMATYGVDKPLMHTEGSLICPEWGGPTCNPPGEIFYDAQADYAVWMYVRNWAEGMAGTVWYQFEGPGWRHGGMMYGGLEIKPAFTALQFLNQELKDAGYIKPVSDYPGLHGYEFYAPDKRIWVLWSPTPDAFTITLPENMLRIYDKFGSEIIPESDQLPVKSPIYLEFAP
ncbi:MAG: hypothetical protein EHM70_10270 [Chloroflexota bacterium]|nr:MAG: hypothetical protein EHM70_10270 [Chloroflexota bacterium]